MTPKERAQKPYLLVDVDGVLSLFGSGGPLIATPGTPAPAAPWGAAPAPIEGGFHAIDGMLHFLSLTAAAHLLSLAESFELVWASGWEEKADEYLPHLLGLPAGLPFVAFTRPGAGLSGTTHAHWKLDSITQFAGNRALAWIDDAFNPACHRWAASRTAPTLLVSTSPERGLTQTEAAALLEWARLQAR
jgi:hypothetical protein